jgi:flagellar biosynthesis/type III secretory pathway protein FliH
MSETLTLRPAGGLAGLLSALQPREALGAPPPPDLDTIRADAWNQGVVAGQAAADAELAPLRDELTKVAAALHAACVIDVDGLRPLVAALVTHIAETVLMAELQGDPRQLLALVDAALAAVRPGMAATLHANPTTLAALRPHLPDIATVEEPGLAPDGFVVSGTDFVIEVGLAARLQEIMGEIA